MATSNSISNNARWSRRVATVLAAVSVGSMLFLFIAGPTLYPDSELGLWLLALAILLPFMTLLALVIQVRRLMCASRSPKRSIGPLSRTALALLGPIGMAWAVFILTRAPTDEVAPE